MIRDADPDLDAAGCAAVYAPYVEQGVISLERDAPDAAEMRARIVAAQREHVWLVRSEGGRVTGYAYAGPFSERDAYRWSCLVSIYLEPGLRRAGAGRALYAALFERLVAAGYVVAAAGMTVPNEASDGLHRAMGFAPIGVFREVGWKHGRWHDVAWFQRRLAPG